MEQKSLEMSNYNHKEELATFVTSLNELIDKYNFSFEDRYSVLRKLEDNIQKQEDSLKNLETVGEGLLKREEELASLKAATEEEIKKLEMEKEAIGYTDSEVQSMELEDIEALISSKQNKISKIETKISTTKDKISANDTEKEECENTLKDLEKDRHDEEESVFRTEAILKLTESTKQMFNNSIEEILKSEYIEVKNDVSTEVTEEPNVEENITKNEVMDNDFSVIDFENTPLEEPTSIDIEEPTNDVQEPAENEQLKEGEDTPLNDNLYDDLSLTSKLSFLDFDVQEPSGELELTSDENEEDVNEVLETFKSNGIPYEKFDFQDRVLMEENQDRTIKNVEILIKHNIPLDLTYNQAEIYYKIEPSDLEDLLNIITVDEDGNGMGFSIDYTYYVLSELSNVDVDKLIEVYNDEFMNINSKSGLIELLKKTNKNLGDFENNRLANINALNSLGVITTNEITRVYPEFINMDNPLFLSVLNLFDREDLVDKLSNDVKIVPKILDYWKNN